MSVPAVELLNTIKTRIRTSRFDMIMSTGPYTLLLASYDEYECIIATAPCKEVEPGLCHALKSLKLVKLQD